MSLIFSDQFILVRVMVDLGPDLGNTGKIIPSPFTNTLESLIHPLMCFWDGEEAHMDTGIAHTETALSS